MNLAKFWHILTTIPPLFDGLLLHSSKQGEVMQLSDTVDWRSIFFSRLPDIPPAGSKPGANATKPTCVG